MINHCHQCRPPTLPLHFITTTTACTPATTVPTPSPPSPPPSNKLTGQNVGPNDGNCRLGHRYILQVRSHFSLPSTSLTMTQSELHQLPSTTPPPTLHRRMPGTDSDRTKRRLLSFGPKVSFFLSFISFTKQLILIIFVGSSHIVTTPKTAPRPTTHPQAHKPLLVGWLAGETTGDGGRWTMDG
jgi:hypothetical protein